MARASWRFAFCYLGTHHRQRQGVFNRSCRSYPISLGDLNTPKGGSMWSCCFELLLVFDEYLMLVMYVQGQRLREDIREIKEKNKRQKGKARQVFGCVCGFQQFYFCVKEHWARAVVFVSFFVPGGHGVVGMVHLWQTAEFVSPLLSFLNCMKESSTELGFIPPSR
ncbi:hypothetical protein F4801DRAFT_266976 [Xylaria longipes]|nr:hypothetical protein F4801DRAFT_266976 [Xylaria longipes]